jgi:3-oxoacyl-[acyl-carrier protein] reductase
MTTANSRSAFNGRIGRTARLSERLRNAVIYGAGGAIGGAVARTFAREGAKVFLAGRTRAKVDAVATEISTAGGVVETAQVDALDEHSVARHVGEVAERAGV